MSNFHYVVIDLDGTLCNHTHRVHLAQSSQWDLYNSQIDFDIPNKDVLFLIKNLPEEIGILAVTGRSEDTRPATIDWIIKHNIKIDALLMRPIDEYADDYKLKLKMIENFFESKEAALERIAFALDDRDRVVEAFRNYGIPCWQVREGMY